MAEKDFFVRKGLIVTEDIELGHASDTTIARSSAGVVTIEGAAILTESSSNTLTNKTLTTPVINAGSDAEGDIYYRSSGGAFTRLARGSDNQTLMMNGNVPNWETVSAGGSGDVSKVGTPANDQIGVWTGDGTLEGSSKFTFDSSYNMLIGGGAVYPRIKLAGNNGFIYFADNSGTPVTKASVGVNGTDFYIKTFPSDTERLRITTNGEWGIGGANYGTDGQVLTSQGSGAAVQWEDAPSGGASTIGALTDVTMDATNFVDGILIQPNSDGSAPTTGTLSSATENIGIGKNVFQDFKSNSSFISISTLLFKYSLLSANNSCTEERINTFLSM